MSDTPRGERPRPHRPGWIPVVDTARCTGCGWCVAACDLHLLSLEVAQRRKTSVLHQAERCTGCSDCAVACPFHVISMRKAPAAPAA
uniref:ATP-binding protein n=1 Tax=unclassified Variovorax TaxID=663243 RepID=UPI000D3C13C2